MSSICLQVWDFDSHRDNLLENVDYITLTTYPLLLGAVCNKWHEIAWTTRTPELWTMLLLWVPQDAPSSKLSYFCSTWLARSDVLPLSIRFKHVHPERAVDFQQIRMVIYTGWLKPFE